ncbi:DegV family protein [Clostridium sp. A1-XYC3]|uniref:DegV family protein n=1 Tax=Clostridium tanneri TaxID=3037988 RepID=A0ABU4JXB1_9CLOT|nr:DegV family protein [Clostridium sp. A1-XYC3]MDW8802568.1 DegV family protein [Clostridium sp. A1-XYC3]
MKTILITDSCSDLPLEYIENNNIIYMSLTYEIKGQEFKDDFWKTTKSKEFYDKLREGELSKTSQVNSHRYYEEFKKHITQNNSIIYVGFSSALSGSTNSAAIAREQLLEEFKDADITVVDTKGASMGQGLLVYYANEMLKRGDSKEEVVNWLEENKLKLSHWFTVEDLNHLKRGGRISSTAAVVGTLLNIKPVLHVDNEGKLVPVEKVKGRKKSLKTLVDKLSEKIVNAEEQIIGISHGDCIEDAEHVRDLILEQYKVKEFIITNVGPVIGSHSGPGTVALFFLGSSR